MDKGREELPLQYIEKELQIISRDPLAMFDLNGVIIDVNGAFVKITGKTREELVGSRFYDHFENQEKVHECIREVFIKGDTRDCELVLEAPGEMHLIFAFNLYAFKNKKGDVAGAFAAGNDITEREQAKQELLDLQLYTRQLIEVSPDPLVTFDHDGTIMDVNQATIRATARNREEIVGTHFASYFSNPEKAQMVVKQVFETGEVKDYELVMKARDGTETIVAYNASVYTDLAGKVVGAFAAARDITERKKSQQELEDTVKSLEIYTSRINKLMTTALEQIKDKKTNVVILDITGVPLDVEVTDPLMTISRCAKMLGATCIVTGIKREAVNDLMKVGAMLSPITTERSLKDGLRYTIAIIE